ncbi:hypothetical protein [Anaerophilus nitritogenes]|uniref:hypothetical protein n=1 Tax=Anaerophilus nitritogenes TaxID=2498136 RepID=UPI0013EB41DF|nr:hypothetical protein [Anaerophilus nitritogenes]
MKHKTECAFCKKPIFKEDSEEIISSLDFQVRHICSMCGKKFEELLKKGRERGCNK